MDTLFCNGKYDRVQLKDLLDKYVDEINAPEFIDKDPVQFPRRFSDLRDIEIMAFLSAIIAWGNRTLIRRDTERLISEMQNQPYHYLMEKAFLNFNPDKNVHRTLFGRHFIYFMNGLYKIYSKFDSLDEFSSFVHAGESELPSYTFVKGLQDIMIDVNGGLSCPECIPTNLETTPLKRFNMALRWLVRDDGIVDMGLWKSIPKNKLLIPLDVHVGNTSRKIGLINRKANDKKTTLILTDKLRDFRPDDPVIYDFALFGIGVSDLVID